MTIPRQINPYADAGECDVCAKILNESMMTIVPIFHPAPVDDYLIDMPPNPAFASEIKTAKICPICFDEWNKHPDWMERLLDGERGFYKRVSRETMEAMDDFTLLDLPPKDSFTISIKPANSHGYCDALCDHLGCDLSFKLFGKLNNIPYGIDFRIPIERLTNMDTKGQTIFLKSLIRDFITKRQEFVERLGGLDETV